MGVGWIFYREGPLVDFYKNFSRVEPKVVKFDFSYSKLRKQLFFLKFSKSRGGLGPSGTNDSTDISQEIVCRTRQSITRKLKATYGETGKCETVVVTSEVAEQRGAFPFVAVIVTVSKPVANMVTGEDACQIQSV